MWGLLRIVLLVANALFFATLLYVVAGAGGTSLLSGVDALLFYAVNSDPFLYGLMTCFALNFVYLLRGNGSD
jgi:hypothetical protein